MEEKEPKDREERHHEHFHPFHHKSWRDPVGGIFAGLVVIWLGISFYLQHRGIIPEDTWWQYFLVGLGGAFLIGGIIRLFVARWRRRALGMLIPGIVVGAIGVMFIMDSFTYWPIILVAVGVVIIISVLTRYFVRRRREKDQPL
ncbi:hypothetical protein ES703_105166 [subsurface metagenome]